MYHSTVVSGAPGCSQTPVLQLGAHQDRTSLPTHGHVTYSGQWNKHTSGWGEGTVKNQGVGPPLSAMMTNTGPDRGYYIILDPRVKKAWTRARDDLWWTRIMGGTLIHVSPWDVPPTEPSLLTDGHVVNLQWKMGNFGVQGKVGTWDSSLYWLPESCRLLFPKANERAITPPAVVGSGFIPTGITVFLTNSSLRQLSVISTVAQASVQSHTLIKHNLAERAKTWTNWAPLWGTDGLSWREFPLT